MKYPTITFQSTRIEPVSVLGWLLLFTNWSEDQRTRVVIVGALSYAALVVISAFQTFSGLAPLDLSLWAAILLGLGMTGLLGAYALALMEMRKRTTLPLNWGSQE